MKKPYLLLGGLLTLIFLMPQIVLADSFDYSNIISDEQAINYQSMNQVEIRSFLRSKDSPLANYWYNGYNPSPGEEILEEEERTSADYKNRSASEVIYNAAHEAKINPQFLLTLLQKEMSLVEDTTPTERQLAFAMGYYCYDGQSCNPGWRGFGKQVRGAALQFRWYIDNINSYNWKPNVPACADDPTPFLPCTANGTIVTPANKITAAMYIYTPHTHGNKLFKTIWDRYDFGDSTPTVITTGVIPEGSLVKARDGEDTDTIYLIHNNKKQAFSSVSALASRYDIGLVLPVASTELEKFVDGNDIKYPAYSILESPSGDRYLLDGLQKRKIASDEVFRSLGFNPEEIEVVSSADLNAIEDGAEIADVTASPLEALLRDTSNGGVYYVKDGKKYPIVDPEIIDLNYPELEITNATAEQLASLQKLLPAKIKDGTLVISDESNQVYVIADGKRRWVSTEQTFIELGYSWANIKQVSDRVLKLHKVGEQLSL
jgi:hypothetical protein